MSMLLSGRKTLSSVRRFCYIGIFLIWFMVLLKFFGMTFADPRIPTNLPEMKALIPILITGAIAELSRAIISTAVLVSAIALIDIRHHFLLERKQEALALKSTTENLGRFVSISRRGSLSKNRRTPWLRFLRVCYLGIFLVWFLLVLKVFGAILTDFRAPFNLSEMKALVTMLVTGGFTELSHALISSAILVGTIALIDVRYHLFRGSKHEVSAPIATKSSSENMEELITVPRRTSFARTRGKAVTEGGNDNKGLSPKTTV